MWIATALAAVIFAVAASILVSRYPGPAPAPPGAGDDEVVSAADLHLPEDPAASDLLLGEPSPSVGWEEAAAVVAEDLRLVLAGRPRAGAYEDARAEAARQDLALFPPERARLRRLLLGSERERLLALAALAARPELDDDLLRVVLRSQRPEDDELVRLLGAEVVQALPPELLSRHEDDLLRAFAREANPLVLAVALPALERMDGQRLRGLLRAQLARSGPEMLPILLGLARSRFGPGAFEDLPAEPGAGSGEPP